MHHTMALHSLASLEALGNLRAPHLVVITDDCVKGLYAEGWVAYLREKGLPTHLLSIAPGEISKTRQTKEYLEDQMELLGCGRDAVVIGLGGGVVTDLAGFVAATFCRGVRLLQIPTTLMGMVDAAMGGKTGVNTSLRKNGIGAVYFADSIWIDLQFLQTLPWIHRQNGMAEVIKYGAIASPSLLEAVRGKAPIENLVDASIAIKERVIKEDPYEIGYRRVLNFGHTIGHALEVLSGYTLLHGHAVAIGMAVEGALSVLSGYLPHEEWEVLMLCLQEWEFSLEIPYGVEEIWKVLSLDKKAKEGQPRAVLLKQLGTPLSFGGSYCVTVDQALLRDAFSYSAKYSLRSTDHSLV